MAARNAARERARRTVFSMRFSPFTKPCVFPQLLAGRAVLCSSATSITGSMPPMIDRRARRSATIERASLPQAVGQWSHTAWP